MPQHQRKIPISAALLSLSAVSHSALADDITKQVEDALKFGNGGAVKIDLNTRYENVNQDNVRVPPLRGTPLPAARQPDTANAVTTRLRLGLLSPVFHGLQGYVEYQGLYAMDSNYNSTRNGKTGYSVVADPYENELDQLWISYAGIPDTVIKGGRQVIQMDDQRFIGNVGWRQLQQTYDSALITNKSINNLTINAGYIGRSKTITATTEDLTAPILNVNYKVGDYGSVSGYAYWLDFTDPNVYFKSNQSYGLRFNGATPKIHDHYNLLYTAEWSIQSNYQHSPKNYTVNRWNLMGGLTAYMFTLQGAMEQLDGVGQNQAFQTPLGTNFAFQGWADQFLVTPNDGIRDVFGTATVKLDNAGVLLMGVYHNFYDDTGNIHYGKEWDFRAVKKFGKHYSLLAQYAYYDADQYSTDTQKVWVQGTINF
ncbi:MAG: alginate export family protein [Gammaproteobacteria bacterium]